MNKNTLTVEVSSVEYTPRFFKLQSTTDRESFNLLIKNEPNIVIYDDIVSQIEELVKILHPTKKFTKEELQEKVNEEVGDIPLNDYGLWVYYSWNKSLVHLLNKNDFIMVRTSRNKYKITDEEQKLLQQKSIGIIGLSVGQSVAVTLAMERTCGELRLCDFDVLELSNYNRIRTKLTNLGLKKTVSVAREIMEIDPFISVKCFHEGLNRENADKFFLEDGKLDLCIDECDGIDMKIFCRIKAKEYNIPVLMEASDNCTIDVERFDLEPERSLLHGNIESLDIEKAAKLKTNEEKVPYLMAFMPPEVMTERALASLFEIEETITTWPQLASSVAYGGAICANIARRIFLGTSTSSGRFQLNVDEHFSAEDSISSTPVYAKLTPKISPDKMSCEISNFESNLDMACLSDSITELVRKAGLAPSGGNMQPWLWSYKEDKGLFQFIDKSQQSPLLDHKYAASLIALGASAENLVLAAKSMGFNLRSNFQHPNLETDQCLISHFDFSNDKDVHPRPELAEFIEQRITNRKLGDRQNIPSEVLNEISQVVESVPGASLKVVTDVKKLNCLAEIYGQVELARLADTQGHKDFMSEIRWSEEEEKERGDGINIWSADITYKDYVGFLACKQYRAIEMIRKWNKGSKFVNLFRKTIDAAGAIGLITMPSCSNENLYNGGRALQRAWLAATKHNIAFQPQSPVTLLFYRLAAGGIMNIDPETKSFLELVQPKFNSIFELSSEETEVFMFRLALTTKKPVQSYRRDPQKLLTKIR